MEDLEKRTNLVTLDQSCVLCWQVIKGGDDGSGGINRGKEPWEVIWFEVSWGERDNGWTNARYMK